NARHPGSGVSRHCTRRNCRDAELSVTICSTPASARHSRTNCHAPKPANPAGAGAGGVLEKSIHDYLRIIH
ncbi:hypothetical protein, partial [Salmonella enterica]|uniref:hypothetical protein n=1 Tax=Salmonella enterica TaxID=28901 RepID=UPI001EE85D4C